MNIKTKKGPIRTRRQAKRIEAQPPRRVIFKYSIFLRETQGGIFVKTQLSPLTDAERALATQNVIIKTKKKGNPVKGKTDDVTKSGSAVET